MGADARVIGTLLFLARDDLEDAKLLRGRRNAAYHLEQAAEKIIKAVLTSEGIHAGLSHQLGVLVDGLSDQNTIKVTLKTVVRLEAYATTFRYGTPVGRIQDALTEEDEAAMVIAVEAALDAAMTAFDVDLSQKSPVARRTSPIR